MKTAEEWFKYCNGVITAHKEVEQIQQDARHSALSEAAELSISNNKTKPYDWQNGFKSGVIAFESAILVLRDKKES